MFLLLLAFIAQTGAVANDLGETLYDNAYLGCYTNRGNVGLTQLGAATNNMTVEYCAQMAHDMNFPNKQIGHTFFVLENGNACFASNDLVTVIQNSKTSADCTNGNQRKCTGNPNENCGGANGAMAVWKLGGEVNGPDYWLTIGLPVGLGIFGLGATVTFAWYCYAKGKVSGQSEYIRHSIA